MCFGVCVCVCVVISESLYARRQPYCSALLFTLKSRASLTKSLYLVCLLSVALYSPFLFNRSVHHSLSSPDFHCQSLSISPSLTLTFHPLLLDFCFPPIRHCSSSPYPSIFISFSASVSFCLHLLLVFHSGLSCHLSVFL